MIKKARYIFVQNYGLENQTVSFFQGTSDLIGLEYNEETDKFFELGDEVKPRITATMIPVGKLTRDLGYIPGSRDGVKELTSKGLSIEIHRSFQDEE